MASPDRNLRLGFSNPDQETPSRSRTPQIPQGDPPFDIPAHGYPIAGAEESESYVYLPKSGDLQHNVAITLKEE